MDDLLMKVANYGFPMVVAIFLLVRIESKLEALTSAINRLEQVLTVFLRAPATDASPTERAPLAASGVPLAAAQH